MSKCWYSFYRVRCTWKKFKELALFLTSKGVALRVKGKVYESSVRSSMIYGSETWPMKAEHESKLETTDMRMIRWICGVSLRDKHTSLELRSRLGVKAVGEVCWRNRLRWFGHAERKVDDDWVRRCILIEGNQGKHGGM
jgi:hypothetical protein